MAYRPPPAPPGSCIFQSQSPHITCLLKNFSSPTRNSYSGPRHLIQAVPTLKAALQDCQFSAASHMPTRTAVLLPGAGRTLTYLSRAPRTQNSPVPTSVLLQGPGLSLTLAENCYMLQMLSTAWHWRGLGKWAPLNTIRGFINDAPFPKCNLTRSIKLLNVHSFCPSRSTFRDYRNLFYFCWNLSHRHNCRGRLPFKKIKRIYTC